VLTQCHCIKVAAFYLFKALICMVHAPLAYKDFSFCDLGRLGMPNWSVIIFKGWAYFSLLGDCDRYKALTILSLSPQKLLSSINFLDNLAFCTLILLLLGLSLTFWCLLCLTNIYEHVWLFLCSCLYYEAIWLVWPMASPRLPVAVWFSYAGLQTAWNVTCERGLKNPCV